MNAEKARSKIAKAPGPKRASKSKGLPQLARISQLVNAGDYQRVAAQLCAICWRPWGRANLLDCASQRSTNLGGERAVDAEAARLYHAGRYSPSTYQHSLAIREKAFAPKHPDIAAAPDNLAVLHWAQGRDTEGEQRSIAITQKSTGIRAP